MNEQIAPLLEKLAEKLGTTAEKLWGVLVRQARIEAWLYLSKAIVYAAIVFGIAWIARFLWQYPVEDDCGRGILRTVAIVGGCGGIAPTLDEALKAARECARCFINPEYWALAQILSRLG